MAENIEVYTQEEAVSVQADIGLVIKGEDGKDGVGIKGAGQLIGSVEDGGLNKYVIELTDGTKSEFIVYNGSKGSEGHSLVIESVEEVYDGYILSIRHELGVETIRLRHGTNGEVGATGGHYIPVMNGTVLEKWQASKSGMSNIAVGVDLQGPAGKQGENGVSGGYYTPKMNGTVLTQWVPTNDASGNMPVIYANTDLKGGYSPTINVSKTGTTTTLTINDVNGIKTATIEDGANSEGDTVPDYWQSEVDEKIADIRAALVAAGRNKSAFFWWHDAHWNYNYQKSPLLLKYLYKHTTINKTNFGGDVLETENGLDLDTLSYVYDWRNAIRGIPNHHSVIGNHDDGNSSVSDGNLPEGFIYSFLLGAEEQPNVVYGDGYYYYIDDVAEKTRYLYLDTATKNGNVASDEAQEVFVREALKSTPRGWHIVPIAHIWLNVDYDVSPPVATDFSAGGTLLLEMFDNYNTRQGEYATCGGTVEFCIGGHSHVDNDYVSATGIPVILTECDSRGVRSGLSCTEETTTENSVNAIIADYTNNVVNVIRIGRGESRTVPINHVALSAYTNQLPIATDADGNVYNTVGYKDNTRINSSGVETEATGWDLTGFIPVQIGDVVRMANMTFFDLTETETYNRSSFKFYDSSYALVVESDTFTLSNLPSDAWSAVYGDNGDLIQFTVPTSYKNSVRYVRICARDLNENTIITVNEVIE